MCMYRHIYSRFEANAALAVAGLAIARRARIPPLPFETASTRRPLLNIWRKPASRLQLAKVERRWPLGAVRTGSRERLEAMRRHVLDKEGDGRCDARNVTIIGSLRWQTRRQLRLTGMTHDLRFGLPAHQAETGDKFNGARILFTHVSTHRSLQSLIEVWCARASKLIPLGSRFVPSGAGMVAPMSAAQELRLGHDIVVCK